MRLAFSTLGVPAMPLRDVARLAARHRFHGVELRAHPEEPVHPGIGASERAAAREEFAAAGVEIMAVAGYAKVAEERSTGAAATGDPATGDPAAGGECPRAGEGTSTQEGPPVGAGPLIGEGAPAGEESPAGVDPLVVEVSELVRLAADLGASYVRVFPGGGGRPGAEADADAARRLAAVAPFATDHGVRVLLETHDSHRTGADALRVLGPVGHHAIGALWDVMHTWLGGEDPAASFAALAPHLGYVQVKDIASAEDTAPLPLGAGVLPLADCLDLVSRAGWDGWLCWEYEKRWYPRAAELPGLLDDAREHLLGLLTAAS